MNYPAEKLKQKFGSARITASLMALVFLLGMGISGRAAEPPAAAQAARVAAAAAANESDKTLAALHDELERSRQRLVLPGQEKPYYIQYRLLDLDDRTYTAQFGALISSTTSSTRSMAVDVRVGNYKLDSSNFLSERGFRGFLGSTGTVGIDRDYESLRQDLWLATDQAYKEALDSLSHKRATLRALANAPTVDDFFMVPPVTLVEPQVAPDWTARNWEAEAKNVSAILRNYPQLSNATVTYHLIYATTYLVTTEGTQVRVSKSFAAIEAGLNAQADDGMPLHNFLALYADRPSALPAADAVRQQLDAVGRDLVALRAAPTAPDYDGPVLFEPRAAGSLLAQILGPSLGGARPPLTVNSRYDQMMQALGGHSEWSGHVGQRVLPPTVSIVDDPTVKEFQGQPLIGAYDVDEEGVSAQKVTPSMSRPANEFANCGSRLVKNASIFGLPRLLSTP